MASELKLEISLGNEAMQTNQDLAKALHKVADRIEKNEWGAGAISDANGNRVGSFWMEEPDA